MKLYSLKGFNIFSKDITHESLTFTLNNSFFLKTSKQIYINFLKLFFFKIRFNFLIYNIEIEEELLKNIRKYAEEITECELDIQYFLPKTSFGLTRGGIILSDNNNNLYFTKYNIAKISKVENLGKEYHNLKKLKCVNNILYPKVYGYKQFDDLEILVTDYTKNLDPKVNYKKFFEVYESFSNDNNISHFDLAPWNIYSKNNNFLILDWSNAKTYQENFDKFYCYIFLSFYKKRYLLYLFQIQNKDLFKEFFSYFENLISLRLEADNKELKKILIFAKKLEKVFIFIT
jgi:hypothetical protein